jgi:hypothetical protein
VCYLGHLEAFCRRHGFNAEARWYEAAASVLTS